MIKQHLTVSKDNRKRVYRQADTPRSSRLDIDEGSFENPFDRRRTKDFEENEENGIAKENPGGEKGARRYFCFRLVVSTDCD
ncbi:hypothetical protein K0M31_011817 [Melipona bicolor]|uniref:Uncharacterized protein n=1 Tax=Melipona bicolor TaxID=60889 RepID=A0AA40KV32_9HYME|nr:hypothetical protein K0M31_011817 [Melipona bicolor]